MKYRTRLVMGCAIAAALVAAVAAQDALSKRVSLDLKAMAPADAFGTLASSVGLKAVVDPAVTAPVDILIRNVTARTALTTMCESVGCEWNVAAGTLSVKPARQPGARAVTFAGRKETSPGYARIVELLQKPLPAGMKFENVPLATVSERLSQALGMRIDLSSDDPALQTVTIDFSQKTLMAGLKELGDFVKGALRLGVRVDKDSASKELSPSIMIAIGKPGQVKK